MATYTDVSTSNPDLLPVTVARDVIKEMEGQSAILALSRRVPISTRQTVIPAASVLAKAYWVGGVDSSGLKQTTKNEWAGVNLRVEEVAALVAIPHAHLDDSAFPVWDETKPSIIAAMGAALDAAALFGVDKPASWPNPIYQSAVASGNRVAVPADGRDLAAAVAKGAQNLKRLDGYSVNGFAAEPGLNWELVGLRDDNGQPVYQDNLAGPIKRGLYGFPLAEVDNGAWDSDEAKLIYGDWSKSMVGIRQDITFTRHDSGVITNDAGAVVFNAMQQDSSIWRAVMRVAWATAAPQTRIAQATGNAGRYPFGVLVNFGSYDYS